MAKTVVLLSHDYQFLNVLSTKKAIKLLVKNRVEVIKASTKLIHNNMYMPTVVRLLKSINAKFKKRIPFSRRTVFFRDELVCQYCGEKLTLKNCTIDHVHPQSKGGKNTYLNCVTSCKPCNTGKDNKMLSETNMSLIKKPTHPSFADSLYFKMKSFGIDISDIWK